MAERPNTPDEISLEDSNQVNIVNESSVQGDGRVPEVEDSLANMSLCLCSFCNDKECNVGNKSQHWIGEINFKLQDPQYNKDKYPLPEKFLIRTASTCTIDLSKVVENLPDVIEYMKENKKKNEMVEDDNAPYIPYEYGSVVKEVPILSDIHYIDCEYMLKVSIPRQSPYSAFLNGKMFIPKDHKTTDGNKEKDKFRWIFIPSSDRFGEDVKLDRSRFENEGEISKDDTLCFVVVRGNQFEKYRGQFGNVVPIIQLPENVIGVGYARYWIVKIAKRFQLEYIWMIDDSVRSFKEYIPTKNGNNYIMDPNSSKKYINKRCQSNCFKKMESIVMEKQPNLVAISPRCYRHTGINVLYEFTYKPIHSVMLLNIIKLTEKNINFRPELQYMEDMVFSQECANAGLQLCIWNAILFVDKPFKNGAKTPSK